jgi:adenylate cyclase class IV
MNAKKILWTFVTVLVVALIAFGYWRFYFVFAEGTKAGQLNTFQKKGIMFKTYEGKIIQSGFKANVQSNEFEFSVENERIAEQLLQNSGREVELHYKRILDHYHGGVFRVILWIAFMPFMVYQLLP